MQSRNTKIIYSKRLKRVTLQRVLVSKIIFFSKEITRTDLLVLFDNQLFLEDLASSDPSFRSKFGENLGGLSKLLKELRFERGLDFGLIARLKNRFLKELDGFYLPRRNYPLTSQRVRSLYEVRYQGDLGIPLKQLPPKKFIGKGYSDKGTARNTALDGSPSWQEVASIPLYEGDDYEKL